MAGDGSVIISAHLDDEQAQREIKKLRDAIKKTEEELTKKTAEQSNIKKEMDEAISASTTAENSIKRLNEELSSLKSDFALKGNSTIIDPGKFIQAQEREAQITSEIRNQEAIMKSQDKIAERLGNRYAKITDKVTDLNNRLEYTKEKIGEAEKQLNKSSSASHVMQKGMEKASESAKKFTGRIKTLALRIMVFSVIARALRSIASYMNKVIKSNDEAAKSIAQLKGALITLAQPLFDYVIPAFVQLVIIISKAISGMAQLIAVSLGKNLNDYAESAKNLYKESNALDAIGESAENASEGLAGFDEINQIGSETSYTSTGSGIAPSFDFSWLESDDNVFTEYSKKVQEAQDKYISDLDDFTKRAVERAGEGASDLKLALAALYEYFFPPAVQAEQEKYVESLDNFTERVKKRAGECASDLKLALASLYEFFFPPAVQAEQEKYQNNLNEFTEEVVSIAGEGASDAELAWAGIKAKYPELADTVESVSKKISEIWDEFWNNERDKNEQGTEATKDQFDDIFGYFHQKKQSYIAGVQEAQREYKKKLNEMVQKTEDFADTVWGIGHKLKQDVLSGVQNLVFQAKKVLNTLIDRINDTFTFKNPLEGSGLDAGISTVKLINLPHLAQGAVIPPNRQFAAVLGDQKSGTNVEAPLSTIKQALIEALRESGGQDVVVQLNLDGKVIAKSVVKNINAMTQQAGRSVLKI